MRSRARRGAPRLVRDGDEISPRRRSSTTIRISIRWERIRFAITTHAADHKLTALDFELAGYIDALAAASAHVREGTCGGKIHKGTATIDGLADDLESSRDGSPTWPAGWSRPTLTRIRCT